MRQLSFLFSQFFRTKHYVALEHPNGVWTRSSAIAERQHDASCH